MKNAAALPAILISCLLMASNNRVHLIDNYAGTAKNKEYMKLKITVNGKAAQGILYDNQCSRDFASLLPLSMEMEDYNNTEKIFEMPKKLSIQGAPSGYDPDPGDLAYYEPWGNIAVFYRDFGYSNGLVCIGKVTSGIEAFKTRGRLKVTFEAY